MLWRDLDYLADARGMDQASLDEALIETRNHLALVFHRYLDGEHGRPFFSIEINGKRPEKIDPFLKDRRATQVGPAESFYVDGQVVTAHPFTLPFITKKLTETDRRRAGITTTLRESQGFYIYRQMRLVIWGGTWFSILPKQDVGRLARVLVDVPNTLDHLWALDIKKKSAAVPPPAIKRELRRIVNRIIEPSRKAHTYRGGRAASGDPLTRVWTLIEEREGFRYSINREHPLIKAIGGDEVDGPAAVDISRALQLIEVTFPIHDAYNRLGADQVPINDGADYQELLSLARRCGPCNARKGAAPKTSLRNCNTWSHSAGGPVIRSAYLRKRQKKMTSDNADEVKRQLQELEAIVTSLLGNANHSEEALRSTVEKKYRAITASLASDADCEELTRRLIARLSIDVERGVAVYAEDYKPWLADRRRDIVWSRWLTYKQYLINAKWPPPRVVEKLDELTDQILDFAGNPNIEGGWARRGLVLGDVQSGKTASYLALFNKAADAGYRLIIVLAGHTEYLRQQTQRRVDEGSSVAIRHVTPIERVPRQPSVLSA